MQDKMHNNLLSLISAFDLDSVSWFVFVAAIVAQDHLRIILCWTTKFLTHPLFLTQKWL